MWWVIFIGILSMIVFTVIIRLILHCCFKNFKDECSFCRIVLNIFISILSLDYLCAYVSKNKIEEEYTNKTDAEKNDNTDNAENTEKEKKKDVTIAKIMRSKYITTANHLNLFITFVLVVTAYFLKNHFYNTEWLYFLIAGVIAYRLVSRTVEISVSFFLDCFSKSNEAKSDLDKYKRIKLAFLSLLEEALLFAGIYLFAYSGAEWIEPILGGLHSFVFWLYWDKCYLIIFKFISIYQMICTMILITISFAKYISDKEPKESPTRTKTDKMAKEMKMVNPNKQF